MKYSDYKETRSQGTFTFPVGYYYMTPTCPRYQMQYHWHTHYEIIRIISGTFQLGIDKKNYSCKPGDVFFISSGLIHGGIPIDCTYECVVFDFQLLMPANHACKQILHDITDNKILIHTLLSEQSDEILPIVSELTNALSSRRIGYEFIVQSCLYHLIGIILEHHLYEKNHAHLSESNQLNSIKNVLKYISYNYSNNIQLITLAQIANMNPTYFCRYFKNMTGHTPIDYLNYYRIECACEMLRTQDIPIKEIALSSGFNDESYFIKIFRKYRGTTPKQFLKNLSPPDTQTVQPLTQIQFHDFTNQ